MFDYITPDGPVRPPWLLSLQRGNTEIPVVLETSGADYEEPRRARALGFIGAVLDVDRSTLPNLAHDLAEIARSIPST